MYDVSPDLSDRAVEKMAVCLRDWGFVVGDRSPLLNTDHAGQFMVAEDDWNDGEYALPTRNGADGPWCIVGNNRAALIAEAWSIWLDDREAYFPENWAETDLGTEVAVWIAFENSLHG